MPSGAAAGSGTTMKALFAGIDRGIELLVAAIFAAMVLIGTWQVFGRFVLNATPSWSEEVQIFGHIWLVFLAIPIAYRRGAHITVEAIRRVLSPWLIGALDLLIELMWVGFCGCHGLLQLSGFPGHAEFRLARPRDTHELSLCYGMILGSVYLACCRHPAAHWRATDTGSR
mgnify:CR=1 FL=1